MGIQELELSSAHIERWLIRCIVDLQPAMAPFRNLFLRRSVIGNIDRNHVSSTDSIGSAQNSMRSLSLNTRSSREESPPQYKMSGMFLL